MGLNVSKAAAAEKANVVGEGEAPATFNVVDSDGKWFSSKAQFPMIDAEYGARFEPGVPTRALRSKWVDQQITAGVLVEVDKPADAKGKAATEADPTLDERATDNSGTEGAGMQSAVST